MIYLLLTTLVRFANAAFIPNENGELVAVESETIEVMQQAVPPMPPGDYGAAFVKMILTMIAIIALLFGTIWFLRRLVQQRLQRGVGEQSIRVLEKKMISPKTMLYLIEVDKKKILIAESHLEVKRLENFSEEPHK